MPTYEYLCGDHGAFTAFKSISQYKDPEPCPACATPAPRVLLTAPALGGSGGAEPGGSKPAWMGGMRRHGGGCACC